MRASILRRRAAAALLAAAMCFSFAGRVPVRTAGAQSITPETRISDEDTEVEQNEGLTIRLNSLNLENTTGDKVGLSSENEVQAIRAGKSVRFQVESALSDSTIRDAVTVKIHINPNGCNLTFDRFNSVDENGTSYLDLTDGSGVRLYLDTDTAADGEPSYTIRYSLYQGQTVNTLISYETENGTTDNGSSVEISVDVENAIETDNPVITINGGIDPLTIYNLADLSWSNVTKSADQDSVTYSASGGISSDIVYSFHSDSLASGDSGIKYAEKQVLKDTFEFPEGVKLKKESGSVVFEDGKAIYRVDGTDVMTFSDTSGIDQSNVTIEVTDDGFVFTRKSADLSKEMPPVDLSVTLHKEGLSVDGEKADDWDASGVKIKNTAELTISLDRDSTGNDGAFISESDPVDVDILPAKSHLSIAKSASVEEIALKNSELEKYLKDEGDFTFNYYIDVTNSGNVDAEGAVVTDELPGEIELSGAASSVKAVIGTSASAQSAGGTAEVTTDAGSGQQTVKWTGTVPAGKTVRITVPVIFKKSIKSQTDALAEGASLTVNNNAKVTGPDNEAATPDNEIKLTNESPKYPIAGKKTPVLLGINNNYINVFDLSVDGSDKSEIAKKAVDITGETTIYYMIELYNRNDKAQTYTVSDTRGGGYYGSNNFVATEVPSDMTAFYNSNGYKMIFPVNSKNNLDTNGGGSNPYSYRVPVVDDDGNITGYTDEVNSLPYLYKDGDVPSDGGNRYYFIGVGEKGNVSGEVTVDPGSYTYVFIPFKISPDLYKESSLTSQNIGETTYKLIKENTVTTTNKDTEYPDGENNPSSFVSDKVPVYQITPSVNLYKAPYDLIKDLNNPINNEKIVTDGDYVYYRIDIENNTRDSDGNLAGVPYSFLEVLPPYIKVDTTTDGYSYTGSGPSNVVGNDSFFSGLVQNDGINIASNSSGPSLDYIARSNSEPTAEPYYLQYSSQAGAINAKVYTYQTTTNIGYDDGIEKTVRDAVYVSLDTLPTNTGTNGNKAYFYIRCKVDLDYKNIISDSTASATSDIPALSAYNSVYDKYDTRAKTTDRTIKIAYEEYGKYIIAPEYYDYVMGQLNNHKITVTDAISWRNEGYLVKSINVLPGQEVHYLLTYTQGGAAYKASGVTAPGAYVVIEKLPVITTGEGQLVWKDKTDSTGALSGGDFKIEGAKYNSRFVTTEPYTYTENGVEKTINFNVYNHNESTGEITFAGMNNSNEFALSLELITVKLPDDAQSSSFTNNYEYIAPNTPVKKDEVTHTLSSFNKTASNTSVSKSNSVTTFTLGLDDLDLNDPVSAVSLTDDLGAVRAKFDIESINFGKFTINGTASSGNAIISREGGTVVTVPISEIPEGDVSEFTASGEEIVVKDIKSITWELKAGDTDSVKSIKPAVKPTITVRLKDSVADAITDEESVTNTATFRYTFDGDEVEIPSDANVTVKPDKTWIEKKLSINGEEVAADTEMPLDSVQTVKFEIIIHNDNDSILSLKNFVIHDKLASGLVQDQTVSVSKGPNSSLTFRNGEADIKWSSTTTASIPAHDTRTITYTAKVSDAGGDIGNAVTMGNLSDETPTVHVPERAVIIPLLQKGIFAIDGDSTGDLHTYDMSSEDGLITYTALIYNSSDSSIDLPVSFLTDTLPEDFTFTEMADASGAASGNAATYSAPSGWTKNSGSTAFTAYSGEYKVEGSGNAGTINFKVTDSAGAPVSLSPGEYITFNYICTIDLDARYSAYAAKAEGDEFKSLNTLYLAVDVDDTAADNLKLDAAALRAQTVSGSSSSKKNYGGCEVITDQDTISALSLRYSGGSAEGWLGSDVSVTSAVLLNPELSKAAVLHRDDNANDITKQVTPEEFDIYNGGTIFSTRTRSAIKWEITIDNTGGEKNITGYTISDNIPSGFSLINSETAPHLYDKTELTERGVAKDYNGTNYTYGDVVFVLYNAAGNITKTAKVNVSDDGTFELSGSAFAVNKGNKAVIGYWTYFTGDGVSDGEYTNNATITFPEAVDGAKRPLTDRSSDRMSITVRSMVQAVAGYATSSVKQIILDGEYVDIKNPAYKGAEYKAGDYKDGGDDTGNGYGDGHANGFGNRYDNYVVARTNGDKVGYTLNIRNDCTVDIEQLVIIDKLPYNEDNGTNNQSSKRGSQFTVNFDKSTDIVIEVLDNLNGNTVKTVASDDYIVLFSDKTGYTSNEWNGADISDSQFDGILSGSITSVSSGSREWHTDYRPETDKSFRILLRRDFSFAPTEYVRVYFKGIVGDDAEPGEIAWNSFGYRYLPVGRNDFILAAEPAKVGVLIETDAAAILALRKVDDSGNPLSGVDFLVYADEKCEGDVIGVLTTSENGAAVSAPIGLKTDTEGAVNPGENVFYIKEVTPDGYIENTDIYKVQADEAAKVYDVISGNVICGADDPELYSKAEKEAGEIINVETSLMVNKKDETGAFVEGAALSLRLISAGAGDGAFSSLKDISVTNTKGGYTVSDDGLTVYFTTGKGGVAFGRLPLGRYVLSEIKAPDGYIIADDITFSVTGEDTVTMTDRHVRETDETDETVTDTGLTEITDLTGEKTDTEAAKTDDTLPLNALIFIMLAALTGAAAIFSVKRKRSGKGAGGES